VNRSPAEVRSRTGRAARVVLCALCLIAAGTADAEFLLSQHTGLGLTADADLRLRADDGTDLTFHGVSFRHESFEFPLYYDVRLAWFPRLSSHWGVGLEFVHAKMILEDDDVVRVTGRRGGEPVDVRERVDATIESFNATNGLNLLTIDAIYRRFPGDQRGGRPRLLQPYAGAGVGMAVPHVESSIGSVPYQGYQWHGPVLMGFAGVHFVVARGVALSCEYKLSYADLREMSVPGGTLGVAPLTHHVAAGFSLWFP
jgi:lipid A oxidase